MKYIFIIISILILNNIGVSQNVTPPKKRIFTTSEMFKNNTRKNTDLSITTDNLKCTYIGGDRYAVDYNGSGYVKTNGYDIVKYNDSFRLIESYILKYPNFKYIKNLDMFSNNQTNELFIIGGSSNSKLIENALLTKVDKKNPKQISSKSLQLFINKVPKKTGGVTHIPLLYKDETPIGINVGIIKDFEVKNGGVFIVYYNDNLDILDQYYISHPKCEISFNDIVQVGFPENIVGNVNDPSAIDELEQFGTLVALTGGTAVRGYAYNVSQTNNYFKEIVFLLSPKGVTNQLLVNSNNPSEPKRNVSTKGADIVFDKSTSTLYTLGNFTECFDPKDPECKAYMSSYFISSFFLDGNFLKQINSFKYRETSNNYKLMQKDEIPTSKLIPYQLNGTNLFLNRGTLNVLGNLEAYKVIGYNNGSAVINNRLSEMGFHETFNLDLKPQYNTKYSTLYNFNLNSIIGKDYILYNNTSSKTLMPEFTQNLISNSDSLLIKLFNSDFFGYEIKHSLLLNNNINGCDDQGEVHNTLNGFYYKDETLNYDLAEVNADDVYVTNIQETPIPYNCLAPVGIGIGNGASTCKGCQNFTITNTPLSLNLLKTGYYENQTTFSINYSTQITPACNTTGLFQISGDNVNSFEVELLKAYQKDYVLTKFGPNLYRIASKNPINNITANTNFSNFFRVYQIVPQNLTKPARINVDIILYKAICKHSIPIPQSYLSNTSTFKSNTPKVLCTVPNYYINSISNVSLVGPTNCKNFNLCFDFLNNSSTTMAVKDFKFSYTDIFKTTPVSSYSINGGNLIKYLLPNTKYRICFPIEVDYAFNDGFNINFDYIGAVTGYCGNLFFRTYKTPIPQTAPVGTCIAPIEPRGDERFPNKYPHPSNPGGSYTPVPIPVTTTAEAEHNSPEGGGGSTDAPAAPPRGDQNSNTETNNNSLVIVPNPSTGEFKINLKSIDEASIYEVSVANISGKIMYSTLVPGSRLQEYTYDVSHLIKADYRVIIYNTQTNERLDASLILMK